ncbi:MAG: elongation factor P maturation arginine rhamnosyltransferase EarP [Rhodocyclaceae bacterium]
MSVARPDWDIFCTVVDNFGDAGVCWRLARQLAHEGHGEVRLWIDDLATLRPLAPALLDQDRQSIDGVTVCRWLPTWPAAIEPAHRVIEAFACELPAAYLDRMAASAPPPVWINLEYLSAEDWVAGCHGLASPHPRLPLRKHFFFPGVVDGTGGLLKERDVDARRTAWSSAPGAQAMFWRRLGLAAPPGEAVRVSLFAYDNAALPALLDTWAEGSQPVCCYIPVGKVLPRVTAWSGRANLAAGDVVSRGQLTIVVLPFMAQDDYDRLLWLCDVNFVRGEDSFVRAQWARRALVWHIYPQDDDAHRIKLDAFLEHYLDGAPADVAHAVRGAWWAWNGQGDIGPAWAPLAAALPAVQAWADEWAERVAKHGDLAQNLAFFCRDLLE